VTRWRYAAMVARISPAVLIQVNGHARTLRACGWVRRRSGS
jgi:hypothetical protein